METTTSLQKTSDWTPDQIELIKNTVAKGCTNDEFKLFIYTAKKYGFDPLIKQVWCVKYGNEPAAIFTGRDGFLHKAHESNQFDGMKTTVRSEPVPFTKKIKKKGYGGKPDEWIDFKKERQLVATTYVYRKDMSHPIEVEVWEEEYSSGQSNWSKMPRTMITKVSESQALRRAFDISGIYSEEEGAVIEASSVTVDTNHVEMLSDEIQKQIDDCNNEEELKNLWIANKDLHKKTYFIQAVNNRKGELKNPTEEKTGYSEATGNTKFEAVLTDEIKSAITAQDSMSGLNAVFNENKNLHGNQDFIDYFYEAKKKLATPVK